MYNVDDIKVNRVKKRFAVSLIVFLLFLVFNIVLFTHSHTIHINNVLIILGIISGILLGLYMIDSNKKYFFDINLDEEKLKEGYRFGTAIFIYLILGLLSFLYNETFSIITKYIYIPISVMLLVSLLISNIWLTYLCAATKNIGKK